MHGAPWVFIFDLPDGNESLPKEKKRTLNGRYRFTGLFNASGQAEDHFRTTWFRSQWKTQCDIFDSSYSWRGFSFLLVGKVLISRQTDSIEFLFSFPYCFSSISRVEERHVVCDELKSVLQEPPPLSLLKTKPGKCIFLKNRRRRFNALAYTSKEEAHQNQMA